MSAILGRAFRAIIDAGECDDWVNRSLGFGGAATPHNPARELALMGVAKRRGSVVAKAQEMRREMGLSPDERLGGVK